MDRTTTTLAEEGDDFALSGTGGSDADLLSPALPTGTILGRYVILSQLGAGAMGVVYSAHDLELDRKVAIKLLQAGSDDQKLRLRLVREAQAMARLNHPNVVTVHDVGEADGQIFVAMEQVRGQTLRAWLREKPRPWREILEIFIPVGRGLVAAHAAGIVHRDFKPDNVMVSEDGRPRVMDFGLARAPAADAEPGEPTTRALAGAAEATSSEALAALSLTLTQAGATLGTPVYMAPELWSGAPADPRSDQYSFCVALWEALYGARPFNGDTLAGLVAAVSRGNPAPKDPGKAPPQLRRALLRGLATAPADRWPSVDALLAELARENRSRASRWGLRVGALAVSSALLGLGGPLGAQALATQAQEAACQAKADAVSPPWDHWSMVRALAALPPDASPNAIRNLGAVLERHASEVEKARWTRAELCRAPKDPVFAAAWMEPQIDLCFERVAHDLELAGRRLMSGDPVAVYQETRGDAAACADFARVRANEVPEDMAARARWRGLRERLDGLRVAAVRDARAELTSALEAVASEAHDLDLPALEREALWHLAAHHFAVGSPERAHASVARALSAAEAPLPSLGIDGRLLALYLIEGVASGDARIDLARRLFATRPTKALDTGEAPADIVWPGGPWTEMTWSDLGLVRPDGLARLPRWMHDGRSEAHAQLLLLAGDHALARSHAIKGLEIADDRPFVWRAEQSGLHLALGRAELGLGDHEAAERALTTALEFSALADVSAARRGQVLLALAELGLATGELGAAGRRLDEAMALRDEALGDDGRYAAMVDLVAGRLAVGRDDLEGAQARFTRARQALLESAGFSRALLADADAELAALALAEGRIDDADASIDEALALRRKLLGVDNIAAAPLLEASAGVHTRRGEAAAAAEAKAKAQAIRAAWIDGAERRARACVPFARTIAGLDRDDPAARAAARSLYDECGAAGIRGTDYGLLSFRLMD